MWWCPVRIIRSPFTAGFTGNGLWQESKPGLQFTLMETYKVVKLSVIHDGDFTKRKVLNTFEENQTKKIKQLCTEVYVPTGKHKVYFSSGKV
ncbi:hypothetical protein Y1Q_0000651 [Alligator mississippiensis]|uniref:Uncharacterized protein n=1 Tax=Alligator mississippiensis TaxID=8496 RepID=A0A151MBX6_ALLMI|nr:hypothetical protein Y1Q_0000651 [Alligator mississippiensis]